MVRPVQDSCERLKDVRHIGGHVEDRFYASADGPSREPSRVVQQNLVSAYLEQDRRESCQVGEERWTQQRGAWVPAAAVKLEERLQRLPRRAGRCQPWFPCALTGQSQVEAGRESDDCGWARHLLPRQEGSRDRCGHRQPNHRRERWAPGFSRSSSDLYAFTPSSTAAGKGLGRKAIVQRQRANAGSHHKVGCQRQSRLRGAQHKAPPPWKYRIVPRRTSSTGSTMSARRSPSVVSDVRIASGTRSRALNAAKRARHSSTL